METTSRRWRVTRNLISTQVLAGLRACLVAVERFDEPLAALLDALRNDISRVALAPDVAAGAGAFSDIASTREPDVLEAARMALGRVARGVDDGTGAGALDFLRCELAHQTSALDRAVADGRTYLYGIVGAAGAVDAYGDEIGGPLICELRDVVDWAAINKRDDIEVRAATVSGGDRAIIARTLRASSDTHHLVYKVAPVTMHGLAVDKKPFIEISCVVNPGDANVTGSSTGVTPRRFLETDAAHMLAAMRCLLHSGHAGSAPISLEKVGFTVPYWAREVHRLVRTTPTVRVLDCNGSVLRMGLACETYARVEGGDERYDFYGRDKNHYGMPAGHFPWESSGCGDVRLSWSAAVDADAFDDVFNCATGLTPSALQRVHDAAAKTLHWTKGRYNVSDMLYSLTFVRKSDWDAVTSVEGSGVIEGAFIARGLRMDVAVANADEGGFLSQVIAEAFGLVPGVVQCINQWYDAFDRRDVCSTACLYAIAATSARWRRPLPSTRHLS